ncbi:universal stress protein family protein [Pseudonocardia hierapolitana]|uniref:Universal stress protein family protein n=1 Tax=Pseudonocardia hierapolitana TaxID=1128676 RepID=A0A561SJU2_9PSEU|nr:universal stress protein [Pseudonocardia hierapolitana]TWF75125.1 universal stress protein family protein [Pseudonocardia hierapolitana]
MTHAVVVCADQSPAGLQALRWATSEAERHRLPLTVVTEPQRTRRSRNSAFAGALAAARAAVPGLPVIGGASGDSPGALLRRLSIGATALVVPATLPELEVIVADAYCPVVTVPARDPSPDAVHGPVLLGAAPWTPSNVIELAFQAASDRGTKVLAVRAWSEPPLDLGRPRADPIAAWDGAEQRVRRELDHALSAWTIIHPDAPIDAMVVQDRPTELFQALSHRAQLLVLGRSTRGALVAGITGSPANALLRTSACPVMVVPTAAALQARPPWLPTRERVWALIGP